MSKAEFLELVKKYEIGVCTDSEENILFKYCDELQAKDKEFAWSLSEEEQVRVNILRRIHSSIGKAEPHIESKKVKRFIPINYYKWTAAVVVFLAITTTAYLRWYSTNSPIPTDTISLMLQDGTILPINEQKQGSIVDENGTLIGEQQGHTFTYASNYNQNMGVHRLSVPNGKTFQVILSDGTKMHLNAGSSVSYPVAFAKNKQRNVKLNGEAFLDVAKDKNRPFIVDAGGFNIRVLGTRFNVSAYAEDQSAQVVLVEGAVGLYAADKQYEPAKSLRLAPGYQAIFAKSTLEFTKTKVATNFYTAWMEGELVIRNMTFSGILKKLERVYDVTIVNNNRALSSEVFNANFGTHPPLETVLQELKAAYGISYTMKDKILIIN